MRTLSETVQPFRFALAIERLLSTRGQRLLRYLTGIGCGILFSVASFSFHFFPSSPIPPEAMFGLGFILLGLWLGLFLMYSYHNFYYFHALSSIIGLDDAPVSGTTYEVATALKNKEDDLTKAFITSALGKKVLLRTGLTAEKLEQFLTTQRPRLSSEVIATESTRPYTMVDLGRHLLSQDKSFSALLKGAAVSEETFFGALRWVVGSYLGSKRAARWWSKDNLSRVPGIGREMSYGRAYHLERYSRDIHTTAVFSTFTTNSAYAAEKVEEIEATLARAKAANVLLIGEPGVGKMDLVITVARRMASGQALDAIAGKHIIVLDTERLFALNQSKQELEIAFLNLLSEARRAGNLVIAIENLGQVVREAEALGVFLPELLDEYLASPELNIIATDTPSSYHTVLQPMGAMVRRFAEVLVEPADLSGTINLLQSLAETHEGKHRTLCTYQAIIATAKSADQYLVEGVMPDKAVGLLLEVVAKAGQESVPLVSADFVYSYVSQKTGIPTGPIKESEKETLLHLEDKLHQMVIGQEDAIAAIAGTMRRARAGIQQADKPIGSFLFLGPTGVGKTETAKALATVFFGSHEKMQRIDMSEYSSGDALSRLIGNGEVAGTLPTLLTEHPYCVLLLDEFEKATTQVHDLFLQILDEGIFTDARGQKINARNTIVIATSNAGSRLIINTVSQRKELATLHDEIIAHIISQGLFRPELINRFDNTIIFEPLTLEEQGNVAQLMLGDLYERIKERGYDLMLTRDLVDVLVAKGYDPEFGARPMQRVLQNTIEEKVAQKIIAGEVQPGDTITLTKDDFLAVELAA